MGGRRGGGGRPLAVRAAAATWLPTTLAVVPMTLGLPRRAVGLTVTLTLALALLALALTLPADLPRRILSLPRRVLSLPPVGPIRLRGLGCRTRGEGRAGLIPFGPRVTARPALPAISTQVLPALPDDLLHAFADALLAT